MYLIHFCSGVNADDAKIRRLVSSKLRMQGRSCDAVICYMCVFFGQNNAEGNVSLNEF